MAARTIPDGRIHAEFSLWVETKTTRDALSEDQLRGHLGHLDAGTSRFERLLVVTPDVEQPAAIPLIGDDRVTWTSFADISDAIDAVLSDPTEVVSERETLLLRELQKMFDEDGSLAPPEDVVIVAAGSPVPSICAAASTSTRQGERSDRSLTLASTGRNGSSRMFRGCFGDTTASASLPRSARHRRHRGLPARGA